MSTLDIEMLPARQGDAILLTWGADGHSHAMLVDAGPIHAYDDVVSRLERLPGRRIDLLVMTHIDADHIEGTIRLISDRQLGLDIGEVWFNGARHLSDYLAAEHGEILGMVIEHRDLPWNVSFGGHAVRLPDDDPPTEVPLCCGLRLTVLAPTAQSLEALSGEWRKALARHHLEFDSPDTAIAALEKRRALVPEDSYLTPKDDDGWLSAALLPDVRKLADSRSGSDDSLPNASSIVLLAELDSHRVLLAGDTTAAALTPGLERLLERRCAERLPLAALKVPHHGSKNNITDDLVEMLPARNYLFSTSGAYFKHPDEQAVATVLAHGPPGTTLWFNYEQDMTTIWSDDRLRRRHRYSIRYPEGPPGHVRLRCGDEA